MHTQELLLAKRGTLSAHQDAAAWKLGTARTQRNQASAPRKQEKTTGSLQMLPVD
jgi:hypothetical protein